MSNRDVPVRILDTLSDSFVNADNATTLYNNLIRLTDFVELYQYQGKAKGWINNVGQVQTKILEVYIPKVDPNTVNPVVTQAFDMLKRTSERNGIQFKLIVQEAF